MKIEGNVRNLQRTCRPSSLYWTRFVVISHVLIDTSGNFSKKALYKQTLVGCCAYAHQQRPAGKRQRASNVSANASRLFDTMISHTITVFFRLLDLTLSHPICSRRSRSADLFFISDRSADSFTVRSRHRCALNITMTVDDCGVNLGGWNAVTDAPALQMTGGCGSTRSGNVTSSIGRRSRYTGQ